MLEFDARTELRNLCFHFIMICLTMPAISVADESLIKNGSFEFRKSGEPNRYIETLKPGSRQIRDWTVVGTRRLLTDLEQKRSAQSHTNDEKAPDFSRDEKSQDWCVDWIGPERWTASHGKHCLDLDGGIRQTVTTEKGKRYRIQFDLGGNPELGGHGPAFQTLILRVGKKTRRFYFDQSHSTVRHIGWKTRSMEFTAKSRKTEILFFNAKPNLHSAGVALDNVAIYLLPSKPHQKGEQNVDR